MTDSANSGAIEAWNTVLFDKFVRFKFVLTQGLSAHGTHALVRHPPGTGAHALDLGCGFGDSTLEIAAHVGPMGRAVGVDAAANFVHAAEVERGAAEVSNARFFVADVQNDPLGGPYDFAFSRFGTMFFASPVAALRNVRRSLKPSGRLVMAVWRKREDNPWVHAAELRVKELVAAPEESDAVTCGPGPFSMAGADMVTDQLLAAGFLAPTLERHDIDICIGRTLDEAVDFALEIGPAGEHMRLAGAAGERKRPEVVTALRETLAGFQRGGMISAPSSAWIISATAP